MRAILLQGHDLVTDLHVGLRTEVLDRGSAAGVEFVLASVRESREHEVRGAHARPTTFSTAGVQRTDFLAHLGFRRGQCSYLVGECYSIEAGADFELSGFLEAFPHAWEAFRAADADLGACGLHITQPEGWGYFFGREGQPYRDHSMGHPNGHTAGKIESLKTSEDGSFRFALTWLEGPQGKGWTTHYRPRHPPLSQETLATFSFLGLRTFDGCPEFEWEACSYRFIPFEARGDSVFDTNASYAHQTFDAHAGRFGPGIKHLLDSEGALRPFGLGLLRDLSPIRDPRLEGSSSSTERSQATRVRIGLTDYEYDVAISFAGTQRPIAEVIAEGLRANGVRVFYDNFYPEQLWGKDLVAFFNEIYERRSRFCLILISSEYNERMWTIHERQSAQARSLKEKGQEYILPVKVEDVDLPGMPSSIGYLSLKDRTPESVADLLIKKIHAEGAG